MTPDPATRAREIREALQKAGWLRHVIDTDAVEEVIAATLTEGRGPETGPDEAANNRTGGHPATEATAMSEPILQYFAYAHLPAHLQMISKPFCDLAHAIVLGDNAPEAGTVTLGEGLPRNPERTVALRKLLEAKDAAVRAKLTKNV